MRTYEKQVLINVTGGISRGGTGKRVPKISGRAVMQKPPLTFLTHKCLEKLPPALTEPLTLDTQQPR